MNKNYLVLIFASLLPGFIAHLSAQQAKLPEWDDPVVQRVFSKIEPLRKFGPESEDISKRTLNAKHFSTGGGKFEAVVGAGPMHYWENNAWNTLSTELVQNHSGNSPQYPYYNKWNFFKTYFGKSGDGIRMSFPDFSVDLWQNLEKNWLDASGNILSSSPIQPGIIPSVSDNVLTYSSVFQDINAKAVQLSYGIETELYLQNSGALNNAPSNAAFLTFSEKISLPLGWSVKGIGQTKAGFFEKVMILDENGKEKLRYQRPYYEDNLKTALQGKDRKTEKHINGAYQVAVVGNEVTLSVLIPAEWILSPERRFPVKIDPVVTTPGPGGAPTAPGSVITYNSYGSTQTADFSTPTPSMRVGFEDGTFGNSWYQSAMEFDVTSIPNTAGLLASSICNVELYMYQQNFDYPTGQCSNIEGAFRLVHPFNGIFPLSAPPIAVDPEVTNGFPYTGVYGWGNSAGGGNTAYNTANGWKGPFNLGQQAKLDLANSIPLDYYHVGIKNEQGGHGDPTFDCSCFLCACVCEDDDYIDFSGNDNITQQPYLVVTYVHSIPNPATACGNGTDANPNNDWFVWGFSGSDLLLNPQNVVLGGFYQAPGLNVASSSQWAASSVPSAAAGWDGCTVTSGHTVVYKRCGFPCGQYDVVVSGINGTGAVYFNGNLVPGAGNITGAQTVLNNVVLDASSSIEIRQISGGGASGINVNFNRLDSWQAFIGNDTALCLGADLLLTGALNGNGTFGNLPCLGGAPGTCPPLSYAWSSSCPSLLPSNTATPNISLNNYSGGNCTIYLTVTSEIGCTSSDEINITELPSAVINATVQQNQICSGDDVTVLLSGYAPGTTISWSVFGGAVSPGISPPVNPIVIPANNQIQIPVTVSPGISSTQSATIQIIPFLNACPGISASVNVSVVPKPQIAPLIANNVLCSGSSVDILLSNSLNIPVVYSWSRTNGSQTTGNVTGMPVSDFTALTISGNLYNNTATPQVTTFTVTTFATTCAADPVSIPITVNPTPVANIIPSGPTSICQGSSVNLNAQPTGAGFTYTWSTGSSAANITANTAGTYQVIVSNTQSCRDTASLAVTVNPIPPAQINVVGGSNVSCEGSPITLNAFAGNYAYSWNTGYVGPYYTVNQSGTYTVTVSNPATGCSAVSQPVNITINPKPNVFLAASNLATSPICESANITLDVGTFPGGNGTAPFQYTWYLTANGNSNVILSGTQSSISADLPGGVYSTGTYTVVVTDANGCKDTTNIFSVNPQPVAVITALDSGTVRCEGDTLVFTASGGDNYTWGINTGTMTPSYWTANLLYATHSGTYSVIVQDANGCTDTTSTPALTFNPSPAVQILLNPAFDSVLCRNETVTMNASPSGMSGYQWYLNGVQIPGANADSYLASWEGNYSVGVSTAAGCTAMDYQMISVIDTLLIDIISSQPDLAFCEGQEDLILTASQGGTDYQWLINGSQAYIGNPLTVNNANYAAPGLISVTVTNGAGCISHDLIQVSMDTVPNPAITNTPSNGTVALCEGDVFTLQGAGGPSYTWYHNGQPVGTAQNYTVTANGNTNWTGLYTLSVTNAGGCTASTQMNPVTLVSNPEPYGAIYAVGNTHICKGQSVTLVATETTGDIIWTKDGVPIPETAGQSQYLASEPGTYNIVVTNICGTYTSITPITVTQNDNILATFTYAPTLIHPMELIQFSNFSIGGNFASWEFGDGDQSTSFSTQHGYAAAGEYQVHLLVSDELGCSDDTSATLVVIPWGDPFIPNIFTPNGDGFHDEWEIYYADLEGVLTRVYDRWGAQVFQTTAKDNHWNGMNVNRNPCHSGVYFYTITASKPNGDKVLLQGNVTLMR